MGKIGLLIILSFGVAFGEVTVQDLAPPEGPFPLSDYPLHIGEYQKKAEKYMEEKKKVCQGKSKKLPRSCSEKLKEKRKIFIGHIYELRRQYLISLHQNQLKQLDKGKNTLLRTLEASPKKGRRGPR